MKNNYILFLILLITQFSFGQERDLYFSMYAEGSSNNKFIEIYNPTTESLDLSNYMLKGSNNGGDWKDTRDLALTGTLEAGSVYVVANDQAEQTILDQADLALPYESPIHFNGDDAIGLFKKDDSGTFVLIDVIGVPTEDPGSGWEVAGVSNATKDHTLTRKVTICSPNTDWTASAGTDADSSEWLVTDKDSEWGSLGAFNGCSSSPSLAITAPTDGTTIDFTTTVSITLDILNFEVANGTGDGHIHYTLNDGDVVMKYDTDPIELTGLESGTYAVKVWLVDNSHTALDPAVEDEVNFTIQKPCDITLGDITTTCDALTNNQDTFNGSIAFTGGNTGAVYTITAKVDGTDIGTIGGDDPSTVASGTITVTGIPEGTDVEVTIIGDATSSCDYTRTLYSPACISFPIVETFDYAADSDLVDAALWQTSNSGDEVQVVASTISNPYAATEYPDPTGNMISFDGAGKDPYLEFNELNSGALYSSFIFSVTDMTSFTKADGEYWVVLTEPGGSYKGRLWLKKDDTDDTKFKLGISTTGSSSAVQYSTNLHAVSDVVFVVFAYDFTSEQFSVWENPNPTDFDTTTAPTADITAAAADAPEGLARFLLRQDKTSDTPFINFDELRISTSWKDVTPKGATASIDKNTIAGFNVFPNPVVETSFKVSTANTSKKEVIVYNVLGRKIKELTFTGNQKVIDISGLNSGIYLVKVTEDNKTATKKLVIR